MFNKLKQYKDLRGKAKTLQATLSQEKVEGAGAWGKVKISMDGNMTVIDLAVADELLTPTEKDKLQTGIKEALNDAIKKAQQKMVTKMKESGDFQMPGM